MRSKGVPSWLLRLAAIGLGFFVFVIVVGVLPAVLGSGFTGLLAMLLVILLGLAAAYLSFRYSKAFMLGHISKASRAQEEDIHPSSATARNRRIAMAMLFSGMIFFVMFIFAMLSGIISVYE